MPGLDCADAAGFCGAGPAERISTPAAIAWQTWDEALLSASQLSLCCLADDMKLTIHSPTLSHSQSNRQVTKSIELLSTYAVVSLQVMDGIILCEHPQIAYTRDSTLTTLEEASRDFRTVDEISDSLSLAP